jgi:hypothetical protein
MTTNSDAVAGQRVRGVRPRAWWRESALPECRPCVTTCEDEAQHWRDEGHDVRELGDVEAARARIADGMRGMVRLLRLPDAPQYPGDERHTEKRVLLALAGATVADSWPNDSLIRQGGRDE